MVSEVKGSSGPVSIDSIEEYEAASVAGCSLLIPACFDEGDFDALRCVLFFA
jgi:hypothetical protein